MNPFKIIKYQLYLLQLENYELGRYFRLLRLKGFWPKGEQRKELVWTAKAKAVLGAATAVYIAALFLINLSLSLSMKWRGDVLSLFMIVCALVMLAALPFVFFTIAIWLLYPVDAFLKARIISQAKFKIKNQKSKITVIGIAGSYGKTTIKEVLTGVLGIKYKVLSTPESVNTPVGIGRWILKELDESVEVIIVEMGEHYKNDVKEICDIVKPDIAVITGINQAHLERFGTLDNTIATIFEAAEFSKPGALLVLNADDKLVVDNYKKFCKNQQVDFYSSESHPLSKHTISGMEFKQDGSGQNFEINGEKFSTRLLAEYAIGDAVAATIVGKHLGESVTDIKIGVSQVKTVAHRLEPIINPNGIIIIDDSYNGNPQGVVQAIGLLAKFTNKRKIYLTPGLVEMGSSAPVIHQEIGKQLAGVADVVILIKNSVTGFIEQGIKSASQLSAVSCQLLWFHSAPEAHAALKNILKPGDVILFQNDWGDNYV